MVQRTSTGTPTYLCRPSRGQGRGREGLGCCGSEGQRSDTDHQRTGATERPARAQRVSRRNERRESGLCAARPRGASTRQRPAAWQCLHPAAARRLQAAGWCSVQRSAAWMRLVSIARTRESGAMLAGTRQRVRRAAARGRGARPQKTPRRREPEQTAGASS